MAQRNIHEWLEAYGESHQNQTNKLIHWVCVPGIFLTIAGLLWCIPSQRPWLKCRFSTGQP